MRSLSLLVLSLLLGCGNPQGPDPKRQAPGASLRSSATLPNDSLFAAAEPADTKVASAAGDLHEVADLRTQKIGTDWSQFLGPLGTSVSPETGILSPWPREGLRVVWHKPVGTGYGMPSISRGRLYQFDRHGNRAHLSCMKSETGELLWTFSYPTAYEDYYGYNNGPRCCPIVDDDRVYIYGAEGMLQCLHARDGHLLWKVDTRAEFGVIQNFFGIASAPVVEGALLIVQVGGSPKGSERLPVDQARGDNSGIVAFDKYTGKVKYRITNELASYASPVMTTINGRRWGFMFARGGLIGFEPSSGKVDFHYPWRARIIESVNGANPVVAGDRVFISETYGPGSSLLKVKPGSYELLWSDADKTRNKSMQCHWSTPIYHEGYLYGCSGRHESNAELRCIELETGRVIWSQPNLSRTSLLMVDGHFLCLAEEGQLLLLKVNARRYEEISRWDGHNPQKPAVGGPSLLEPPCWAAPILSHGLLYVRGKDQLTCLELIPEKQRAEP